MPSLALSCIHALALALAVAIDLADGEVRDRVCPLHPVSIAWRLGSSLLQRFKKTVLHGVVLWLATVVPLVLLYGALAEIILSHTLSPFEILLVLPCYSALLKFTFSIKLLRWYYKAILENFEKCEVKARVLLQEIVRRDVFALTQEEAFSALIETFIESLVDGVASPLLYYSILGLPGAYLQRLANTMDSLVGYPYEPYREIGKFSAHVDTVLNLAPAIVISLLIVLIGRGSLRKFVRIVRDSGSVRSLNARLVFAAIASSLNIRLEKPGDYVVNPDGERPSLDICRRVLKLCDYVLAVYLCIVTLLCLCVQIQLFDVFLKQV